MGDVRRMSDNHVHGVWGYRHWKCRCDVCLKAYEGHIAKRRKHREPPVHIDPEPLIEFILKTDGKMTGSLLNSMVRWRASGVDLYTADRHCIKRGAHPSQIYGDDWWHFGRESILEGV